MKETADSVREIVLAKIDRSQKWGVVGIECYGRLSEIHVQTARQLLTVVSATWPAIMMGDGTGLFNTICKISAEHWKSVAACGAELHGRFSENSAKK